jgi:D-serine deaminase-like pyridoxal phosphate-dependent protein
VDDRLGAARRLIGEPRDAAPTPALLVDLPKVERNIARMAERMAPLPASLRPHVKIHKSPALARMQLDAGAIGVTTATVWEAAAMVDGGVTDVLVANQCVGRAKAAELARLCRDAHVTTLVESRANADELAAAGRAAGSEIGALVEVDVGFHRCGVRSIREAVELGRSIEEQPGIRLLGLLGYEGHCMLEPDRAVRIEKTKAANNVLVAAADEFVRAGLPTRIVAAGGFGTWDITGANPRITEIHAGSYIFFDAFHRSLVPGFDVALTVLATVISRTARTAILDCGRKSIGIDRALPELVNGEGWIRFEHGEHYIHEEHVGIEIADGFELDVGDRVELMAGYAPTTVNLYDLFYVVAEDSIVDVWPILGRYGSQSVGGRPSG